MAGGASTVLAHGVATLLIGVGIAVNDCALDTYFQLASSLVGSGIAVLSKWFLAFPLIPILDEVALVAVSGHGECGSNGGSAPHTDRSCGFAVPFTCWTARPRSRVLTSVHSAYLLKGTPMFTFSRVSTRVLSTSAMSLALGSLAVTLAASASAHVTVNSTDAKQGGYGKVTVRVPNEPSRLARREVPVSMPSASPIASVRVRSRMSAGLSRRPRWRWSNPSNRVTGRSPKPSQPSPGLRIRG